jgi:inositol phosphorylceramide mannosyltransferase catalytic subunit
MVDLSHVEMADHIPRIIHQVFINDAPLPKELADNIRDISRVNSTWEHRLYDSDDIETIILKHYGPDILDIYRKINPRYVSARVDLFRYLLIYAEGGFYIDIKGTSALPLDDLLRAEDRLILSQWDNKEGERHAGWGLHQDLKAIAGGEYQMWNIIAVRGHPVLRAVLEQVIDNIQYYNILGHGVGMMGTLRVTGPIAFTFAVEETKARHPHRIVDIRKDFGMESNLFEALGPAESYRDALTSRHYTRLRSPVIKPSSIKDLVRMALFYAGKAVFHLKRYTTIAVRRLFPGNRD